jgi:hypothetical protein
MLIAAATDLYFKINPPENGVKSRNAWIDCCSVLVEEMTFQLEIVQV